LRRITADIDVLIADAEPDTVVVADSVGAILSRRFVLAAARPSAG
jgi:hypothetical protein